MSPADLGLVLTACGIVLAAVGVSRAWFVAREALAPLAHSGDPTRDAIEALRPLPYRWKVRTVAARALVSIGWLVLSLYGLYLAVHGQALLS